MVDGRLLAGIDIGTTGSRCMIFDLTGRCVASAYHDYPLIHLQTGWIEQSLPLMLETTMDMCQRAIREGGIDASRIAGIGLSTQMCGTIACDAAGELLRPMISWQATRATAETAWFGEQIDPREFGRIAGVPLTPVLTLLKILWIREHEPEIFERTERWLQVHHMALRALGADGFYSDSNEVNLYGLWDVSQAEWSTRLLELTGLNATLFGEVVPSGTRVGAVSRSGAEASGFTADTPLCTGAGDQMCGLIGMGGSEPGTSTLTLGTGGFLCASSPDPRVDIAALIVQNHVVPDRWLLMAAMLAAASAYQWFRDVFGQAEIDAAERDGHSAFEHLNDLAAQAPPGANGLLFLPYLNSAGSPHWNAEARAAFIGIAQNHDRAAFARAVLEGVAFEVRDNLEMLTEHGMRLNVIRASGGATRSALWTQIQADVYGIPVQLLEEPEAGALGAAMLGGVGAGVFSSVAEAESAMVRVARTVEPDPRRHKDYGEAHAAYVDAYQALASSTFGRLAHLGIHT